MDSSDQVKWWTSCLSYIINVLHTQGHVCDTRQSLTEIMARKHQNLLFTNCRLLKHLLSSMEKEKLFWVLTTTAELSLNHSSFDALSLQCHADYLPFFYHDKTCPLLSSSQPFSVHLCALSFFLFFILFVCLFLHVYSHTFSSPPWKSSLAGICDHLKKHRCWQRQRWQIILNCTFCSASLDCSPCKS